MKKWMMGALLVIAASHMPASMGAEFAVIVAKSNPIQTASKEDVQRYFLKNPVRRWDSGAKIVPVELISNDEQSQAVQSLFGMSLDEYKRYWASQRYVTGDRPPKDVGNDEMAAFFADNEGAIGVIAVSKITPALRDSAKVIYQSGK